MPTMYFHVHACAPCTSTRACTSTMQAARLYFPTREGLVEYDLASNAARSSAVPSCSGRAGRPQATYGLWPTAYGARVLAHGGPFGPQSRAAAVLAGPKGPPLPTCSGPPVLPTRSARLGLWR